MNQVHMGGADVLLHNSRSEAPAHVVVQYSCTSVCSQQGKCAYYNGFIRTLQVIEDTQKAEVD